MSPVRRTASGWGSTPPGSPALALAAALLATGCQPPPPATPTDTGGTARIVVSTEGAPAAIGPYSQAIRVGGTLYLAGQIALDPASGEMVPGGIEAETRQVMDNLGAVLGAAGFSFADVVQSQVFLVDLAEFPAMNEVYATYFDEAPPARATVGVAALPRGARVEITMTAVRGG